MKAKKACIANRLVGFATPFGTFRHVAFTKSTSEDLTIYVDGVPQSSGGGRQVIYTQPTVELTAGRGSGNFLECIIDEIRVHDTYLLDTAIAASFAAGPSGLPTTTVTQVALPNAISICFTGEVGAVYTLQSANDATATYTNTGGTIIGTSGAQYLFDPSSAGNADKVYRVMGIP